MRTDLTEQEWADVAACREAALMGALTGAWTVEEFRDAAAVVYAAIGQPPPLVVVAPGPLAACLWAAALREQLRVQLGDQLQGQLGVQLGVQLGSVQWSWWTVAWLSHWRFVAGLDGIAPPGEDVLPLASAYRTFCLPVMTIPCSGVVIVCGQHSSLNRNAQGALHCTDGPAWAWPDGTAVYALDGIRVPEWVVAKPNAHRILNDLANTEQRRVAFAHLGWDRVVSDLRLKPIDTHPDPHVGTLYDLPKEAAPGPARLLVARNASPHTDGTWQTYGLLCSPDAETAQQAQASLAGLRLADWQALDGAS